MPVYAPPQSIPQAATNAIAAAASSNMQRGGPKSAGAGAAAGEADGEPAAKKAKKVNRMAAGMKWSDDTLEEWDKSKLPPALAGAPSNGGR